MFLSLLNQLGLDLLDELRVEEEVEGAVERLATLRVPLLHQVTELVLQYNHIQ